MKRADEDTAEIPSGQQARAAEHFVFLAISPVIPLW
jgi:hypothetical protein